MGGKYLNTRTLRATFRGWLRSKGRFGAYNQATYRERIAVHMATLNKYLSQFPKYYRSIFERSWEGPVTVRRVYDLFNRKPIKILGEFKSYFENKTHLSYEVGAKPRPIPVPRKITKAKYIERLEARTEKQAAHSKMGEFVFLILAEYVILHNYMWASGLRPRGVRSIDKFLKEIK